MAPMNCVMWDVILQNFIGGRYLRASHYALKKEFVDPSGLTELFDFVYFD